MQFSDRLVEKITQTSNIVVGIDPNFDLMPKAILPANGDPQAVTNALVNFAKLAIDTAYNLIPAVKF
ncbi:MAG TPA: orotidine-5'-phosphate decarboxylase, partial [Kamptonema sp.]|nr:orotidine-5'-phosphate decarboxylase [Kamptonema sp.]